MRRGILLCLIGLLMLQGCSVWIAHHREEKRDAINSKVALGISRPELLKILGTPIKGEGGDVETFKVCIPKYSDAVFNSIMDIAFVGVWEIFATPYELVNPCEFELEWVVTYDKKDRVSEILKKGRYKGPDSGDQSPP